MKYLRFGLAVFAIIATVGVIIFLFKNYAGNNQAAPGDKISSSPSKEQLASPFPVHKDIIVSFFWVGEGASRANDFIANSASAWDEKWAEHFGGTDDPDNRNGSWPADFKPKENPFYFALPYNDFDSQGDRKPQAYDLVYWEGEKVWGEKESMCKNRWIKISKNGLNVYAQWEDAGPFGEDDWKYVFGNNRPQNTQKSEAGLDVSPAVRDFLGISGIDVVDWQFVNENEVPNGPWKEIVTTRNGN